MKAHHPPPVTATQRLTVPLTPLDTALAALLDGLETVASEEVSLADALGCIAAEMPPLHALPAADVAAADGWALNSRDLVGASPYSPLPLTGFPVWVEVGDRIPDGCECVIHSDLVEQTGSMIQISAEAIPGQGVRRAGGNIAEGKTLAAAGVPVRVLDLLLARAAGLKKLAVCRPRLRVINVSTATGIAVTTQLIADSAWEAGADVSLETGKRDARSIADALETKPSDLLIIIGGTGVGYTDATVEALAMCGTVIAHGIALQPGRTAAAGRIKNIPVIALPGAPDQALSAWWTLALPVLDRLSGRRLRQQTMLPLSRKIASSVGIAEIVLVEKIDNAWMPLAIGDLSLDHIARADAWLSVPAESEGFAAGTLTNAYMLKSSR